MRALKWRSREVGWRIGYRLLVIALQVLAVLRYLAAATAIWLHRAHTALAERGDVLVDTMGSGVDTGTEPESRPEDFMPRVITLPPAVRAEEVRP
jgi:hypothetical protein